MKHHRNPDDNSATSKARKLAVSLGLVTAIGGVLLPVGHAAYASTSQCWAVPDTGTELRTFIPDLASPKEATVVKFLPPNDVTPHKGEGLAYRAKTNAVALFDNLGGGVHQMSYFDIATGVETVVGPVPDHIEAAGIWTDPKDPTHEELWVTSGGNQLYQLNPDTAAIISGPHVLGTLSVGGLGLEPTLGTIWVTDDKDEKGAIDPKPTLWSIDKSTFAITKVADLKMASGTLPDAEAFDFGADGQMYTENEDKGDLLGTILQIDPATGLVTPVATAKLGAGPPIQDHEGLACNGGYNAVHPTGGPALKLDTFVNGDDADAAPGPKLPAGSTATLLYRITNVGGQDLTDVVLTSNMPGLTIVCPGAVGGTIPTMAIGAVVECTASFVVTTSAFIEAATVSGNGRPATMPDGKPASPPVLTAGDPLHFVAAEVPATAPIPTPAPTASPSILVAGELPETGRGSSNLAALAAGVVALGLSVRLSARRTVRRPN